MLAWQKYEKQCIWHHRNSFPQQNVYHWTEVPEDVLEDSGFLTDKHALRMERKKRFTESNGTKYYNVVPEYGLDGIAVENGVDTGIPRFIGIQAKCYEPNSILCGSKLGSFFAIINGMNSANQTTKGMLYHTCRLEKMLQFIFERFASKPDQSLFSSLHLPFDETFTQDVDESETKEEKEEEDLGWVDKNDALVSQLRDYQEEAVTQLDQFYQNRNKTVGLLHLPCGTGKTVIMGSFLQRQQEETLHFGFLTVIVLSPTRQLAKQNMDRFSKFLPPHHALLVDSDYSMESTRDTDEIAAFLAASNGKVLISSTYQSAEDVLSQVFLPDSPQTQTATLIVDEAHNLANNQDLQLFCTRFPKTVLMTATPLSVLKDGMLQCETIYHYPMREAILKRYICDYTLYLPVEFVHLIRQQQKEKEKEKEDEDKGDELMDDEEEGFEDDELMDDKDEDDELMDDKDEDDELMDEENEGFEDDDDEEGRRPLFSRVEKNDTDALPQEIQTLFVESFGLNKGTLIKKAMYLIHGMLKTGSKRCIAYFTSIEECDQFAEIFSLLMEKYHFLPYWIATFTSNTNTRARTHRLAQFEKMESEEEGVSRLHVLCSVRILDEGADFQKCDCVFLSNLNDQSSSIRVVQRLCRANRLNPNNPNKMAHCFLWADENLKSLAALKLLREEDVDFASKLRFASQQYDRQPEKEKVTQQASSSRQEEEMLMKLDFVKWFSVKAMSLTEVWEYRLSVFKEFVQKFKRVPKRIEIYEKWRIGVWFNNRKSNIKDVTSPVYVELASVDPIVKHDIDRFLTVKEQKLDRSDQMAKFVSFVAKEQRLPKATEVYENWRIGVWFTRQKSNIKDVTSPVYVELASVDPIVKHDLDRFMMVKKEKLDRSDQMAKFVSFVVKEQRLPKTTEVYRKWRIGRWFNTQKSNIKDVTSPVYVELASVDPIVKHELDRFLIVREQNQDKEKLDRSVQMAKFVSFVAKEQRLPKATEVYEKWRIGPWFSKQKSNNIKDVTSPVYVELASVDPIVKDALDRFLMAKEQNQGYKREQKDDEDNVSDKQKRRKTRHP